jgi:hypothetical protein
MGVYLKIDSPFIPISLAFVKGTKSPKSPPTPFCPLSAFFHFSCRLMSIVLAKTGSITVHP